MKNKFIIFLLLIGLIITYNKFGMDKLNNGNITSARVPVNGLSELVNSNENTDNQNLNNSDTTNLNNYKEDNKEQEDGEYSISIKILQKPEIARKVEPEAKEYDLTNNYLTLTTREVISKEDVVKDSRNKTARELAEKVTESQNLNSLKEITLMEQIKEHKVKKGDSLWTIAREHNIDIDTLIGANDINDMNRIKPGEVIKILPVKGIIYKIGPGENLSIIADKFEISIKRVIDSNQIADPERVYPGKMLILPGAKPEFGYRDRLEKLFIKPINARISSYFGRRWGRMHEGLDYATNIGTQVRAAGDGKVVYSGWARGYGQTIIIEHQKGLRTLYGHNSKLLVGSGEWVSRGELISKSGNTGTTTGPNMHFEVQVNGRPTNPLSYLR